MSDEKPNYMYSSNGCDYTFDDPSELFDDGLDVGDSYWRGIGRKPKPSDHFHGVDQIVENLMESMWEYAGDYSSIYQDEFDGVKKEELEKTIKEWLDSNTECHFCIVGDSEKFTLLESDLTRGQRETYREEQLKLQVLEALQ